MRRRTMGLALGLTALLLGACSESPVLETVLNPLADTNAPADSGKSYSVMPPAKGSAAGSQTGTSASPTPSPSASASPSPTPSASASASPRP